MPLSQYWSNNLFPELVLNTEAVAVHRADKATLDTELGEAAAVSDSRTLTVTVDSLSTSDTTPELTGTVNDPNATIDVTVDGNDYTATNNGDGTWTLADDTITPALSIATYAVAVTATGPAGNTGSTPGTGALEITA